MGDALAQRGTWPERLRRGAWPSLALLPATLAGLAVYRDETSHHFVAGYAPTRDVLAGVHPGRLRRRAGGVLALGAGPAGAGTQPRAGSGALPGPALPPVFLAVAVAAYVNASLYLQWVPRQPDLLVNLRGARDLLAGTLPYHDAVPVWADRVHLLPVTLVLLFGPLAALGDDPARVLFFLRQSGALAAGAGDPGAPAGAGRAALGVDRRGAGVRGDVTGPGRRRSASGSRTGC